MHTHAAANFRRHVQQATVAQAAHWPSGSTAVAAATDAPARRSAPHQAHLPTGPAPPGGSGTTEHHLRQGRGERGVGRAVREGQVARWSSQGLKRWEPSCPRSRSHLHAGCYAP